MNAIVSPTLTDRERAEIRNKVFGEHITNPVFVLEAMGEKFDWHVHMMRWDATALIIEIRNRVDKYLEANDKYAEAEQEALSSKSVNGARFYEA